MWRCEMRASSGFKDEVEIKVSNKREVVRPLKQSRHNWEQAFKTMAQKNDDTLIDFPDTKWSKWEEKEWEWR